MSDDAEAKINRISTMLQDGAGAVKMNLYTLLPHRESY